jgi:hypothetical protein
VGWYLQVDCVCVCLKMMFEGLFCTWQFSEGTWFFTIFYWRCLYSCMGRNLSWLYYIGTNIDINTIIMISISYDNIILTWTIGTNRLIIFINHHWPPLTFHEPLWSFTIIPWLFIISNYYPLSTTLTTIIPLFRNCTTGWCPPVIGWFTIPVN